MPQILIGEFGGITGIVLVSVWEGGLFKEK